MLLQHGAEANSKNKQEDTGIASKTKNLILSALHMAVRAGRSRVAQILCEFGANVKIANLDGFTPIDVAQNLATHDIYNILVILSVCIDCIIVEMELIESTNITLVETLLGESLKFRKKFSEEERK